MARSKSKKPSAVSASAVVGASITSQPDGSVLEQLTAVSVEEPVATAQEQDASLIETQDAEGGNSSEDEDDEDDGEEFDSKTMDKLMELLGDVDPAELGLEISGLTGQGEGAEDDNEDDEEDDEDSESGDEDESSDEEEEEEEDDEDILELEEVDDDEKAQDEEAMDLRESRQNAKRAASLAQKKQDVRRFSILFPNFHCGSRLADANLLPNDFVVF